MNGDEMVCHQRRNIRFMEARAPGHVTGNTAVPRVPGANRNLHRTRGSRCPALGVTAQASSFISPRIPVDVLVRVVTGEARYLAPRFRETTAGKQAFGLKT